ncbi:GNAT family N-acetyltransferase [Streptomyces spectabilis]|uniref:GNAT family N-acetyltransferase n=1 Tax=Streptomyces spectabilis TaxID=68270 RepID=A0A5P2X9B3_STRST|nr:GNAT family N-acetyltransferase [Streptomyces spectabilis]MBB5108676.1 ribosomal protein S18 acetylase RimI-like enzyme [Streptomyces spectabilis]MCI3904476.1 GNAT family N-acetyltransferase [Streptomyces spectabilis]QEV61567.1 GNAT family N-acetyltransferase [Streptomyces spectabilis]
MGRPKKNKPRRRRPVDQGPSGGYECHVEGVRVRRARRGEGRRIREVLSAIDTDYEDLDYAADRIDTGVYETSGPGLRRALVAEATDGPSVVGALLALPPGALLHRLREAGIPQSAVNGVARSVGKLKAVAVAPERKGGGIGAALVRAFVDEYAAAQYEVVFAQVDLDKPGLVGWYEHMGFEALGPGAPLRLDHHGRVAIYPEDDEQLVVRGLP